MSAAHTSARFQRLFLGFGGVGEMTLDAEHLIHIRSVADAHSLNAFDRQLPLRQQYHGHQQAWVYDHARTVDAQIPAGHPIHGHVVYGEGIPLAISVCGHTAVGGARDFSCPGELLATALVSCLDTAIRMIADLKEIKPSRLEVQVGLGADMHGALMTGDGVSVGFQTAHMKVDLQSKCELSKPHLNALFEAAKQSCVI